MDPSGFDNDIFIELVKKRQCIWNTALAEYHDKIKKRNAWEEVCCEMYPDFKEKSEKEQIALGGKLMKKWKNFRTPTLGVSKKTVSGQRPKTGHMYMPEKWNSGTGTSSATVSSLDVEQEEEGVDYSENDGESDAVSRPDAVPDPSEEPSAPSLPIIPATVPTAKRSASSFTKLPARKRRVIVEENIINFMKRPEPTTTIVQPTPQEPDDDRSFFESLLPIVKSLPIDTKLDFRVTVMGVLQEMRASLSHASSATVGRFPSLQRQMIPQPQMSQHTMNDLTPLVVQVQQQQHQQPVGLHSTERQQPLRFTKTPPYLEKTQQQRSFQWESPASSNTSYTSPVDCDMN